MIWRYLALPLGVLSAFFLLWLMWPSPVSPVAWDEPAAPAMTGPVAPNADLQTATVHRTGTPGTGRGIAVSSDGMVYFGTQSGEIMRLRTGISGGEIRPELVARIVGNGVFGLDWINESTLGIATATGLHSLNLTSLTVETLSTGASARALGNVTDLAVGPEGRIYFTDASTRWTAESARPGYFYDMLENRPNGMVYVWDPQSGLTMPLRDRLYYPYGITLASDARSIFVSEPFRYTIQRIWLAGPQTGEIEAFATNLPGMPAGLTLDDEGNLVIAMLTRRSPLLSFVHRNPLITQLLIKLPQWLRPTDARPLGYILRIDESDGQIRDSFHDPDGSLNYISTVTADRQGAIWFGTSFGGIIGRFDPADSPSARQND